MVPEPVRPGATRWTEAVDTAVRTADDLGLELARRDIIGVERRRRAMGAAGDAMKKVVWSEVLVDGGRRVRADPPASAGGGRAVPGHTPLGRIGCSRLPTDWVVLAVPHDASADTLSPAAVTASVTRRGLDLPRRRLLRRMRSRCLGIPDAWSSAWIEQRFDEPVTVRSVVVGTAGTTRLRGGPLTRRGAAGERRRNRTTARSSAGSHDCSRAVGELCAGHGKTVPAGALRAAAPPMRCLRCAEGVRLPPVLRRADAFLISEFALRTGGRVHHAETKAGFGVVSDYYVADTDPSADAGSDRRVDGDRPHAAHRRRRAAVGCTARPLAHPAPGRIAHRADQRPRPGRFDRPRGGQARRTCASRPTSRRISRGSATGRVPAIPRGSPRFSATASRPGRRTGPNESSSISPRDAATTRSPGCPHSRATSSAAPPSPIASCTTTAARSPSCRRRVLRHALGRSASARDVLLRRGTRGRPAAARR